MSILSIFKTQEKQDLEANEELVARYRAIPDRYDAAFKKRDEIHKKEVLPLARELKDQEVAQAPREIILDLSSRMQRAIWDRDRDKKALDFEREQLGREIEASGSGREVDVVVRELQEALRDSHQLIRVDYQKSVHNPFTGKKTTEYASNHAAVERIRSVLLSAIKTLLSMRRNSIREIRAFAEETEAKLTEINVSEMLPGEVPASRANELKPEPEPGEAEKATQMPDGSIHIHPPKGTMPRLQSLSDRLAKLEDGK